MYKRQLIHLIKRAKFAIRPHRCPRRACHVANADYIHTCFRCPNAKNYWKTIIKIAKIIGAEESKTTLLNLVTGIPDIANKNTEGKTKQASITWTCIHTTALKCIWNSWCSHVHENETFNKKYLASRFRSEIASRIKQLWLRAKRKDKTNRNKKATELFVANWCLSGAITISDGKVVIDLSGDSNVTSQANTTVNTDTCKEK